MSSSYTLQQYIDYIKLSLFADTLDSELSDETIGKFVIAALQEVQRYIDTPKFITIPFCRCIDLSSYTDCEGNVHDFNYSAIVHVYRTEGYTGDTTTSVSSSAVDPMYAQTWMAFSSGGNYYNINNYIYNYLSYNTLLQMRNTTSTDLAFTQDKYGKKLYINSQYDNPSYVTIEYIPVYQHVEEVTSDYWIDILKRMSLALVKVALGRVRTRYTQTNALVQDDGSTMLQEGTDELKELREVLRANNNLFLPVD